MTGIIFCLTWETLLVLSLSSITPIFPEIFFHFVIYFCTDTICDVINLNISGTREDIQKKKRKRHSCSLWKTSQISIKYFLLHRLFNFFILLNWQKGTNSIFSQVMLSMWCLYFTLSMTRQRQVAYLPLLIRLYHIKGSLVFNVGKIPDDRGFHCFPTVPDFAKMSGNLRYSSATNTILICRGEVGNWNEAILEDW